MDRRFSIRPASKDDLCATRDLLAECNLPLDDVDIFLERGYCVAVSQENVVGAAGIEVHGCHGLLRSVAVSPAWRGQTVGGALVRDRLTWAEASSLADVYLLTTDAADYFKRFEFHSVDRNAVPPEIQKSSEFSTVCPVTATVMVKALTDNSET